MELGRGSGSQRSIDITLKAHSAHTVYSELCVFFNKPLCLFESSTTYVCGRYLTDTFITDASETQVDPSFLVRCLDLAQLHKSALCII